MDTHLLALACDYLQAELLKGSNKKPSPIPRPGKKKASQGRGLGAMVPRFPKRQ